ncbi:MAG TPA: DUF4224 domain-containing protein [Noviherbaspirillum sp.]|nr:DUF4224 domain-containing protein [Noviherbaspirillum sp.]
MAAFFELALSSETLSTEEIAQISGCSRNSDQIEWLIRNGWMFYKNKGGAPVVGRLYTRLKLSGINPQTLSMNGGWMPDFSQVR